MKGRKAMKTQEPRKQWLKIRVNQRERAYVEALAAEAGQRVSNYLRGLVGLPALTAGRPRGNRAGARRKGKR
jgi:hypothetical protein